MERTDYMQSLMTSTYPMVAIEAVLRGFDGSWERLIAKKLFEDYLAEHAEACEIIDHVAADDPTMPINQATLKAAHLITSSTIPTT